MLNAIAPPDAKVSVRAGRGVGKTTALAIAIWWHLECFDFCRIPCTAPTAPQLRTVLWAELNKVLGRSDEQALKTGLEKGLWLSTMFKVTQDHVSIAAPGVPWFAAARTARKEQPDALQGFHASDLEITDENTAIKRSDSGGSLMFVIEEASGVPDEIFLPVLGALTTQGSRLLMVGNPTRNSGFFADSHLKSRSEYTSLHFSCADSPIVPPGYREGLVRRFGEGSNYVRVHADGEFPKQDDDVLIALEWGEAALVRSRHYEGDAPIMVGVDVARFGSDRSVFVVRQGQNILHIEVHAKDDTMVTAGRACALARRFNAKTLAFDGVGIGGGPIDRVREQQRTEHDFDFDVLEVIANDAATMKRTTTDKYGNVSPEKKFGQQDFYPKSMKEYLWLEMADWFHYGEPSIYGLEDGWHDHAQTLIGECCSVRYRFDSSGKIVVESKEDYKKRIGSEMASSPDIADALALTFAPNRLSIWERLAG